MKIRKIVQDAYKVRELEDQFTSADSLTTEQVNEHYPDSYIIKEAEHRLYLADYDLSCSTEDDADFAEYQNNKKQLTKFINKWKNNIEPHSNDGLPFEDIILKIAKN
jgi:hypothetical protein